jgi:hypothetical protein
MTGWQVLLLIMAVAILLIWSSASASGKDRGEW